MQLLRSSPVHPRAERRMKEKIPMTTQTTLAPSGEDRAASVTCPHPVSLETLAVIEQLLAEMMLSLRRKIEPRASPADAGEQEYTSWLNHGQKHRYTGTV